MVLVRLHWNGTGFLNHGPLERPGLARHGPLEQPGQLVILSRWNGSGMATEVARAAVLLEQEGRVAVVAERATRQGG